MYKKAFIFWNDKMKELNNEYKKKFIANQNGSVSGVHKCENCGRGTIINYNATSLPITEWIKECGILDKFCELCIGNTVYIPYPINY